MTFKATGEVSALDTKAVVQDPEPTIAQWRQLKPAVLALASAAPKSMYERTRFQQDVAALASDIDDIIANGYADSNGGAQLETDLGAVESDAGRAGCRPS